jgi:hypothetical protein
VAIGPQEQSQANRILKEARKLYMEQCHERQTAANVAVETLRLLPQPLDDPSPSKSKPTPTHSPQGATASRPPPFSPPSRRASDLSIAPNASRATVPSFAEKPAGVNHTHAALASHPTLAVAQNEVRAALSLNTIDKSLLPTSC